MQKFGIDLSVWQGDFPLARAKEEGVEFVILKCGGADDGLYEDRRFAYNYKAAKELGLPVGAYFFSRALSVADAHAEADFCARIIEGKAFELPIYLDVENRTQLKAGKDTLTDIVKTWLADMEARGYMAGLYTSASFLTSYMHKAQLVDKPLWIASWGKTQPSDCGLWQFGGETNLLRSNKVCGITVDQNYLLRDYTSEIKRRGLNGYTVNHVPAKEAEGKKEQCQVNVPVLRLGHSSGYVRTAQVLLNAYNSAGLTTDGIFGPATEAAVAAYQKSRKLDVDGIIGPATWAQLLK